MALVEFNYEGKSINIQCNRYDTMGSIFHQFITKADVNPNSVSFLYNGKMISNNNLSFVQIANIFDKQRNKMNIVVTNSLSTTSSQFTFLKCDGADEAMKDYAKMTILLAIQEHPDDHLKKCQLICSKFNERYGGLWNCSFMKEGSGWYHNGGYFMGILYQNYKVIIFNSPNLWRY